MHKNASRKQNSSRFELSNWLFTYLFNSNIEKKPKKILKPWNKIRYSNEILNKLCNISQSFSSSWNRFALSLKPEFKFDDTWRNLSTKLSLIVLLKLRISLKENWKKNFLRPWPDLKASRTDLEAMLGNFQTIDSFTTWPNYAASDCNLKIFLHYFF